MKAMTTITALLLAASIAAQSPCGEPQPLIGDGSISVAMYGSEARLTANVQYAGNLINPEDWKLETKWQILGGWWPFVMGNFNAWNIHADDASISHELWAGATHFIISVQARPQHRTKPQCSGTWQSLEAIQLVRPQLHAITYE